MFLDMLSRVEDFDGKCHNESMSKRRLVLTPGRAVDRQGMGSMVSFDAALIIRQDRHDSHACKGWIVADYCARMYHHANDAQVLCVQDMPHKRALDKNRAS